MTFNFDQYVVSDEAVEDQPLQQPQDVQREPFNFEKYRVKEERGFLEETGRHTARLASRAAETVAGMPGDVVQFVQWLNSKMPKLPKFTEREPTFVQKRAQEFLEGIPSSQELKEKMSEITGGFVDPQSATEEFGDSIVELASALTVGKDPTKIKNLLGSLGKATIAKGARKGAEKLGAGEVGQFATELGTLFMMGLFEQPMADKFVSDKYNKSRELIPEKTMIGTENLTKELTALEEDLAKGLSTSSKEEVRGVVSELKNKVRGGAYPAQELVDSFHDINERMNSKKLFSELSKSEMKKLKFRYDKLKDTVTSEIGKYGKANPEFFKEWQDANQAFSTIQDSKAVSSFINKKLGNLPKHLATGIGIEMFRHPGAVMGTAAATAGTFGALKTGEMLYRVAKSPILTKHYLNVATAAAGENFPAMVNSLNKLESELKKSLAEEE